MTLDEVVEQITEYKSAGTLSSLQNSQYVDLLEPVRQLPTASLRALPKPIVEFLFYGARAFDRWSPPLPLPVNDEYLRRYEEFIDTFRRYDPVNPNLSIFAVHELQSELFTQFASGSIDAPGAPISSVIEDVRRRAKRVPVRAPQLADSIAAAVTRVESICDGLLNDSVLSTLSVNLPHAVVQAVFCGSGVWHSLPFDYTFEPEATQADGMSASEGSVITVGGLTRGGSGTCRVSIDVHRLVDFNRSSPYLSGLPSDGIGRPSSGQPWCQSLLFFVLDDLIAHLQDSGLQYVDTLWTLSPRDIGQVSVNVKAAGQLVANAQMMLGSWRLTTGPLQPQTLDVGNLASSEYWKSCLRHAQGYLTLGNTREALLWLNMAVEALLDERIQILTDDNPELRDRLSAGRLLFDEAESTLASQFPELKGKVQWPDRQQAPSRYSQIKTLCRGVPIAVDFKEATARYSLIAAKRNDVIHGRDVGLVPVGQIEDGIAALQWLADNLHR